MTEEELKKLQDDYKNLQDEYKKLKELNDKTTKENEDNLSKIENLTSDKKLAEDRYTDLFKQTILVSNVGKDDSNKDNDDKEEETMKIEDLYII